MADVGIFRVWDAERRAFMTQTYTAREGGGGGGAGGGLPADTVVDAATRIIANKLADADAQPAFRMMGDGKLEWGDGGGSALDTNLYHQGPGGLKTDGSLVIGAALHVTGDINAQDNVIVDQSDGGGRLIFGASADTSIWRTGVAELATEAVTLRLGAAASLGTAVRIRFGQGNEGFLFSENNKIRTEGEFEIGSHLRLLDDGSAIYIGAGADAYMARQAPSTLLAGPKFKPQSLNIQQTNGRPTDGDMLGGAEDGDIAVDVLNQRLSVRIGNQWVSTQLELLV